MSTASTRTFGAIADWTQELGPDKIALTAETGDRYSRTTQDVGTCPCCILYPTAVEDVQAIVRVAGRHGVPVYPISRGKNWGYGDACAPTEGAAIVDLSRMNRILEVNTELAYAVIEPGVSQGQLHEYLKEHKTGLWMDCTGAGADSSLVGNTLDRGFGHTRYGDHFLTTCGMEVVLADGRVLDTGYGHYPNAQAARVYRYGVGPSLDGIFCQSNYGIVTRIGLWLMPEPEDFAFFLAQVDRDEDLPALVDALRPLRMSGMLNTALHIGNDLRMFSTTKRYPWEAAGGVTPLPENLRARMRHSEKLGAWNAGGSISGTKAHVRATRKAIKQALKGVARLRFVDDRLLSFGERMTRALSPFGLLTREREQLRALKPVYGLLKGQPAEEALQGTRWRLRQDPGELLDPLDTGAGLMWISPVLPMTGRAAREVMGIVEPIFNRFGFDALATFTMINERAMIAILNIYYDKADPNETAEAMTCYDTLVPELMNAGYIPYRVGLRGLPKVHRDDVFWDVAQQIKQALDPGDIIARGRYIPPQATRAKIKD
jgi:4-cresol dehydrogenase (hydroxylating)